MSRCQIESKRHDPRLGYAVRGRAFTRPDFFVPGVDAWLSRISIGGGWSLEIVQGISLRELDEGGTRTPVGGSLRIQIPMPVQS